MVFKMRLEKIISTNIFKVFISIFVIATLVNLLWTIFGEPFFLLNENQLLYFFSTIAQVVAALFGLTLTAYIFFLDKFKELARIDETYYEATNSLIYKYYIMLICIAITCVCVLISSAIGIAALQSLGNEIEKYSFIINQTSVLFLIEIISILIFGIILLDPDKLDNETTKLKREAEEYYQKKTGAEQNDQVNFTEFLRNYNLLENLIITFANKMYENNYQISYASKKSYESKNTIKPRIIDSLKILGRGEIINPRLAEEINELRRYRNGIVHGTDFSVPQSICDRMSEVYNKLNNVYELYIQEREHNPQYWDEWNSAIGELYRLS